MSQLTIQISDKADALIAQLQKEIFNRRRKKVTAEGVVETLLESGAKSQSDKRFATSWQNLVADIEKAALVAQAHGSKPSSLSDEEWALVLSHRTRSSTAPAAKPRAIKPRTSSRATKAAEAAPARRRRKGAAATATDIEAEVAELVASVVAPKTRSARGGAKGKPARTAKAAATPTAKPKATTTRRSAAASRKPSTATQEGETTAKPKAPAKATSRKPAASRSSVARRMAKAASRLANAPVTAIPTSQPAPPPPAMNGSNGVDNGLMSQPTL